MKIETKMLLGFAIGLIAGYLFLWACHWWVGREVADAVEFWRARGL